MKRTFTLQEVLAELVKSSGCKQPELYIPANAKISLKLTSTGAPRIVVEWNDPIQESRDRLR